MALGMIMDRRPVDTGALFPAVALPTTTADLISSSYDNAMANNRFVSQIAMEREAQDKLYGPVEQQLQDQYPDFDPMKIRQQSMQYYALKKSDALGRYARNDREARYAAMMDYARDKGVTVPTPAEITSLAAQNARETAERFQQDQFHTISTSPRMAAFIGEAGGVFSDPVQLAAIAAATPMALTTRVLAGAGIEAGVNLAMDAPLLGVQAGWYREQGRELTAQEVASTLVASAFLGGAIGAVASGLYRVAGGTETRFIGGPNAYAKAVQDQIAANRAYSLSLDDARQVEKAVEDSGVPANSLSYTAPVTDGPFKQQVVPGLDARLYKIAQQPDVAVVPQARVGIMGMAERMNYEYTRPTQWHLPTTAGKYDFTLNRLHNGTVREAHDVNVKGAVEAMLTGETVSPTQKIALTMDLELANGPARVADLRSLREGKVPLSTRSKNYTRMVQTRIREVAEPRLRMLTEGVEVADTPVKPPPKPKMTAQQVDAASADVVTEMARVNDEYKLIQRQWRERQEFERKVATAKAKGKKPPKRYKTYITPSEYQRKGTQLQRARVVELPRRVDDLKSARKAWRDYETAVARADDMNMARKARADLETLADGKIPASLTPLKRQLDATYQALAKSPAVLAEAEDALRSPVTEAMAGRYTPFTPNKAFELDSVTYQTPDARIKAEADTAVVEAERIDQTFSFSILEPDGTLRMTTMKEQLQDIQQIDDALADAGVCARGGE